MKGFAHQSVNWMGSRFFIWQVYRYAKVSIGDTANDFRTTDDLVLKNFPDGGASPAAGRSDSPDSSQIGDFIKSLKPLSGLPDLFLHQSMITQGDED
jgi:hypothetical protein